MRAVRNTSASRTPHCAAICFASYLPSSCTRCRQKLRFLLQPFMTSAAATAAAAWERRRRSGGPLTCAFSPSVSSTPSFCPCCCCCCSCSSCCCSLCRQSECQAVISVSSGPVEPQTTDAATPGLSLSLPLSLPLTPSLSYTHSASISSLPSVTCVFSFSLFIPMVFYHYLLFLPLSNVLCFIKLEQSVSHYF